MVSKLSRMVKNRRAVYAILTLALITGAGYMTFIYIPEYQQGLAYAAADEKAQATDKNLVAANTRFAIKIFKEISKEDEGKNVFISPLSISTALTMVYNGAEGSTKEAMAETLEVTGMTMEELNQNYLNLIESLENADSDVHLSIADSVWVKEEFAPSVKQAFIKQLSTYFKSDLYTRDFDDPKTVSEINSWISTKTNNKINKMIEKVDDQIVMFLINAIYFKGDWTIPFDEKETHTDDFNLPDGSKVKVSFMSNTDDYKYYSGSNYQAVRLPYGRDKMAMYVLLPHEDIDIDSFIEGISQSELDRSFSSYAKTKVDIDLPKFKLEYGVKRLNDALKNLGMGIAFDPGEANFMGIAPVNASNNLYIGFVDHKAFVEVNEKGTEAAAATVVGIELTSMPMTQTFTVDRPFIFIIRDDRSGSILFMGKINNPLEATSP
jgi:serine protease inhibitor